MRPKLGVVVKLLLAVSWRLSFDGGSASATVVRSYGILADGDDVEESLTDGSLYVGSSDYELMYDTFLKAEQVLGLRWRGVSVPKGATILDAVIQFRADPSRGAQAGALALDIGLELAADSLAWQASSPPSNRTLVGSGPVEWRISGLWAAGDAYNSTSVAALLQTVVSQPAWRAGNGVSAVIRRSAGSASGLRIASAFGGQYEPARLVVEYVFDTAVPATEPPQTDPPATLPPHTEAPLTLTPTAQPVQPTAAPAPTRRPPVATASPASEAPAGAVNETDAPARPLPPSRAKQAARTAAGAVAAAGALSGASGGHATRLALLSSDCLLDLRGAFPLHPTQFALRGDYFAGAMLGNLGLSAVVGVLGAFGVFWLKLASGTGALEGAGWAGWRRGMDEMGLLRMPSVSLCVFALLYPGTTLAAAHVVARHDNLLLRVLGGVVLASHLAVPFLVHRQIRAAVPAHVVYYQNAPDGTGPVPYRSRLAVVLFGPGEWVSLRRTYHFVARYASVLRPYTQRASSFFAADCLASFSLGVIQSIEAAEFHHCAHKKLSMGLVLVAMMIVECRYTPHARPRDAFLFVVVLGGQSVALFLTALAFYQGYPAEGAPVYWAHRAAEFLLASAALLMLFKALLDVACEGYLFASKTRSGIQARVFAQRSGRHFGSEGIKVASNTPEEEFSSTANAFELGPEQQQQRPAVTVFSAFPQNSSFASVIRAHSTPKELKLSLLHCSYNPLGAPLTPLDPDLPEVFRTSPNSTFTRNSSGLRDFPKSSRLPATPLNRASPGSHPSLPESPKPYLPSNSSCTDLVALPQRPPCPPAPASGARLCNTLSAGARDSPRPALLTASSVDLSHTANGSRSPLRWQLQPNLLPSSSRSRPLAFELGRCSSDIEL
ncbi:Purple acid phosphatase 7 [Diplonema papillatum]|nr:Purple acid phosphatase 7 [Diplonema papillatum]|eukprot:gene2040-3120_t